MLARIENDHIEELLQCDDPVECFFMNIHEDCPPDIMWEIIVRGNANNLEKSIAYRRFAHIYSEQDIADIMDDANSIQSAMILQDLDFFKLLIIHYGWENISDDRQAQLLSISLRSGILSITDYLIQEKRVEVTDEIFNDFTGSMIFDRIGGIRYMITHGNMDRIAAQTAILFAIDSLDEYVHLSEMLNRYTDNLIDNSLNLQIIEKVFLNHRFNMLSQMLEDDYITVGEFIWDIIRDHIDNILYDSLGFTLFFKRILLDPNVTVDIGKMDGLPEFFRWYILMAIQIRTNLIPLLSQNIREHSISVPVLADIITMLATPYVDEMWKMGKKQFAHMINVPIPGIETNMRW